MYKRSTVYMEDIFRLLHCHALLEVSNYFIDHVQMCEYNLRVATVRGQRSFAENVVCII